MKKISLLISLISAIITAQAQETVLYDAPSIGQNIPNFNINIYSNGGTVKNKIEDYKGKVVILEFWATYCRPCIPAMDHLGELQKQFPNELKVIAVTDEDAYKVQSFLSKRPSNVLIGIDTDKSLNKIFYHQFMPHTVVIDPNGVLRAVTSPDQITSEVISKVYQGVDVAIKPKAEFAPTEEAISNNIVPEDVKSIFKITISERREGLQSQINPKSDLEFEFVNCTIPFIYKYLYQVNNPKVADGGCLEVTEKTRYLLQQDQLYCFTIKVPSALKNQMGEIGISHLEQLFSIKPQVERRSRKVYSLVSDAKSTFKDPNSGQYMTLKELLKTLERNGLVDLPIINDSGIKEDSVLFVERMPKEVEAVEGTLAKLGFRLQQKDRETGCVILYDSLTAANHQTPIEPKEIAPITTSKEAEKND